MIEPFQKRMRRVGDGLHTKHSPLAAAFDEEIATVVEMYLQAGAPYGLSPDLYETQEKALGWLAEMRGASVVHGLCLRLYQIIAAAENQQRGLDDDEIQDVQRTLLRAHNALDACKHGVLMGEANGK